MGEIAGITIDFKDYSAPNTPRVLNIPESAGDVIVQDLWDTLSAEAAKLDNLVYKKLINRPDSGGKNVLSANKSVGITMTMNNVQIKFPDQPGPTVRKKVTDGNLVAVDHNGDSMEPIAISDFTFAEKELDTSAAIVTAGGGSADWTEGERQKIRDALGITGTKLTALGGQLQTLVEDLFARSMGSHCSYETMIHRIASLLMGIVENAPNKPKFYKTTDGSTPLVEIDADSKGNRKTVKYF